MPFWQLFYHVVWGTKHRLPLITPEIEAATYGHIRSKALGLEGTVFAVNGLPDHVHLVVSIPPRIAVATFVGQVKGVTSAKINQDVKPEPPLYWQEEYGVFSFDHKRLPNFVAYVERQKQHHASGQLYGVLERTDDSGVHLLREPPASYGVNDSTVIPAPHTFSPDR
jgi:REP element-mobilizing transposase RayT